MRSKKLFYALRWVLLTLILLIVSATKLFAQEDFKNEGEAENWWIKQTFAVKYKEQSFDKYNGSISVINNAYSFGSQSITADCQPEFRQLFKNGLLYPSIILAAKSDADSMQQIKLLPKKDTAVIYSKDKNAPIGDSLDFNQISIGAFEELPSVEISPSKRRFQFLLYFKGLLNPTLYLIELTNEEETPRMSLSAFIEGAKITFLWKGSILI